ncbi:MAG: SmpB protein, partial [Gammaproteobacteria bacterium]|nr:SmpB protein [Gammaproteobacteria bacterium]
MKANEKPEKLPPIAVNRKARFDYFIEENFE